MPQLQEMFLMTITEVQWSLIKKMLVEHDVEHGDDHEADNVWDCRLGAADPTLEYASYCGRDGWAHGFAHCKLFVRKNGTDHFDVYLEKDADDRAMLLTRAMQNILPFLHRAIQPQE